MNPAEPTATKPLPVTGPRPVLACVADNERGELVAAVAREWAGMLGAEPLLLNVAPDEAAAQRARDRWVEWGGAFTSVARRGEVDRIIRQHAQQRNAQLVILGALEQDDVWTALYGSVARRVARFASCSVLLVPHPEKPTYGRVVASVKFDDRSTALLRYLGLLAKVKPPERLDAIHEVEAYGDLIRTLGESKAEAEEHRHTVDEDTRKQLEYLLQEVGLSDLPTQIECLQGHAGPMGVEYAERVGANLLVVPAPPKPRFLDRFFKQPAELVLNNLPCALLFHRPESGVRK
jgi:nucleotide-binding universal stress UspA family protein